VFADDAEVTHEVFTLMGIEQEFEIPAGASHHSVKFAARNFPANGELLSIIPHMHLRGRSFQLSMEGNGERHTLLDVPQYDFNWQHAYELERPLSLAGIERLDCVAVFDNSADNVANPDPSQRVTWGDQTWEEMAVAFFAVSQPRLPNDSGGSDAAVGLDDQARKSRDRQSAKKSEKKRIAERARKFAAAFFKRHDENEDGVIASHEMPRSIQAFSFGYWDQNGDGVLRRNEIEERAKQRFAE